MGHLTPVGQATKCDLGSGPANSKWQARSHGMRSTINCQQTPRPGQSGSGSSEDGATARACLVGVLLACYSPHDAFLQRPGCERGAVGGSTGRGGAPGLLAGCHEEAGEVLGSAHVDLCHVCMSICVRC